MADCLARAFANLKLWCMANSLQIFSIRGFTVANMHANRNAFPWLGCKGADSIVILKWLLFYANLELQQQGWSPNDRQVLRWISGGAQNGLAFSQGIHGHGIWLVSSCVGHFRKAVHQFGINYAHLAAHCMAKKYCLFGMVPKIHAYMHFRTEFDDALADGRRATLNPAVFDTSMCEDFVGRISRQSRRIAFRNVERSVLGSYQVKARLAIKSFLKQHRRARAQNKSLRMSEDV